MSVFNDISTALDTRLSVMTGLPPVAWENVEYEPVVGTLYLRPTNISGDTNQATLGTSGQDMTIGIYQVDVIAQAGRGKSTALLMADKVANQFKRGTDLTSNGRVVTVVSVQRAVSSQDSGWYIIPVEIIYKSFTDART